MNRAQQILGVKNAKTQAEFDVAINRLVASARLDGVYNPEYTLDQHRKTRASRRSPK